MNKRTNFWVSLNAPNASMCVCCVIENVLPAFFPSVANPSCLLYIALLCFALLLLSALCVRASMCWMWVCLCVLYRWRQCICVCLTFALFFLTSFMLYCLSARHYIYIYFSLCAFPTTHRAMCSIWFWLSIRVDSF